MRHQSEGLVGGWRPREDEGLGEAGISQSGPVGKVWRRDWGGARGIGHSVTMAIDDQLAWSLGREQGIGG